MQPPLNLHKVDYLHMVVDANERAKQVAKTIAFLAPMHDTFDAIAVRGMSGVSIGAVLAHALNKHLILVRKGDGNLKDDHSQYRIEGPLYWSPLQRYIILDDFVASGYTVRTIRHQIGMAAEYVGAVMYRWNEFHGPNEFQPRESEIYK